MTITMTPAVASRKGVLIVALVVIAVIIGLTVWVTRALEPSVKISDEFTGTVSIVNFDATKGCVKDDHQQDRCGVFYTHAKLKAGDKVIVWVENDPAFPSGAEIYLVVQK